jgi:hypothetical protein
VRFFQDMMTGEAVMLMAVVRWAIQIASGPAKEKTYHIKKDRASEYRVRLC